MTLRFSTELPDPQRFFELFTSTGWNEEYHLSPEELHHAIRQSWFQLATYQGDQLVGYGRVMADGVLHALIVDVIVAPAWQGQGIGREIMKRLVARCREVGIRDIQLFCARGKAGFYHHLGFVDRPHDAPGMELKWKDGG